MNLMQSRVKAPFFAVKLAGVFSICLFGLLATEQADAQQRPLNIQVNDQTVKGVIGSAVFGDYKKYTDIRSAITRFKNRKLKEATKFLEVARKKYPTLPPTEMMLAKLFFQVKDTRNGMARLEKAIGEAPEDPEAYLVLANINLREGRIITAKLLAEKGLALTEKYNAIAKRKENFTNQSLQILASVAIQHKNWVEAETQIRKWLKNNPDVSLVAHQLLGRCLYHQNKMKEAYAEYSAAYKEDNKKASVPEVELALLYEKDDNPTNAKRLMASAVSKYPKDFRTRLTVANWAKNTNQLSVATQNSEEAIKLDPSSLNAKILRATTALLQGDVKTAATYYEAAHLQSPSSFIAANHLALILIDSEDDKQRQRGLEFAAMNYERYPINGRSNFRFEAASTMGWIFYKLKRHKEALQLLNAVANAGQLSPDAAFYVASFLHDRRRDSEAVAFLDSAVSSGRPFINKKAAEELLARLTKDNK